MLDLKMREGTFNSDSKIYRFHTVSRDERVRFETEICTEKSWCKWEEAIILKVFEKYFKSTSLPGKAECQEAQNEYPILRTQPWDHLKHKVGNFKVEIQRQSTKGNLISKNLSKGKRKRKSTEILLQRNKLS